MKYWLMKSEPNVYSIADLKQDVQTIWDGVRNYQARNFLRQMQEGDLVFLYHSNTTLLGIVGIMRVVKCQVIDPTQFDTNSPYYDPKSTPESPRWQTVIVEFVEAFPQTISLTLIKQSFQADDLLLIRRGNRLSVMPVHDRVAKTLLKMSVN
jgi:predicted RNA-binding protein with PUA-like domain